MRRGMHPPAMDDQQLIELTLYVVAGLIAQLIDGILGMAYGVSATSLLLAFGTPPAAASASVHTAEVVATAFSASREGEFAPAVLGDVAIEPGS